jgi:hypothetical protein
VSADRAGFGIIKSVEAAGSVAIEYPWWNRTLSAPLTQEIFESPAVAKIAAAARGNIGHRQVSKAGGERLRGCEEMTGSAYLEFYVFDSTVQAAFCLTSFAWLAPRNELPDDTHPTSILALDGTRINGNLNINLWG